eukprot:gene39269-53089_t
MLALIAFVTIVFAAIGGGFYVYNFVHDFILSQYDDNFNTQVIQTFSALAVVLNNNCLASQALSQAFALHCPSMSHWPNCSINAKIYSKIVSPLIIMGNLRDMGPVPIIANPPKNVDSFEEFAYDFYKSNNEFYKMATEDSGNAANNAVFTGGIYSYSPQTGEKYHDIDGFTTFSKNKILTPLLEVYDRNSIGAVMYNLHSEYHRGKAIDQVIEAWN